MGDASSQYGKLDPPDTDNPGANYEQQDDAKFHSGPLKNPHSELMMDSFNGICSFFQIYGWYMLFIIIFGVVIWTNIRQYIFRFLSRLQNASSQPKDPKTILSRSEAMERARLRMQEKYEQESHEKLIKIREREEQKRLDSVKDHDALKAGKSQSSTLRRNNPPTNESNSLPINKSTPKKPLRQSDYNPLTGTSNSGARYRPTSRRPTSGG